MMPGGGREWPPRPRNERKTGPPGGDDRDPNAPYPDVRGAFMLTLFAMLAAAFTGVFFIDFGILAALGVGQALGVGAVATMAAQRVPEPQAKRLGLSALDPAMIPVILCLVPAVLLVREADNYAWDWFGDDRPAAVNERVMPTQPDMDAGGDQDFGESKPGSEIGRGVDTDSGQSFGRESLYDYERRFDEAIEAGDGPGTVSVTSGAPGSAAGGETGNDEDLKKIFNPDDPFSLLQAFIVLVGIAPIVEEFLFRGVIQQGMIARLGLIRGISLAALMWTLLRPVQITNGGRFVVAALASFGLGWALGVVRVACGSVLGPIVLAAAWSVIGLGSLALQGRMDLPGMNVEGTHLPMGVMLASLGLVAWAGSALFREAEEAYAKDELYQETDGDGQSDDGDNEGGERDGASNVVGHRAWGTDQDSPGNHADEGLPDQEAPDDRVDPNHPPER
ncbi:MAG: lysostaphin resistance A-like protein [Myxococcota bacterium]